MENCSEAVNFRILDDGSLEKRCGYRLLCDLGGSVRALWTGRIDGALSCYALVDSSVYSVNISTGSHSLIGSVQSSAGDADFFYYCSRLYLIDGIRIYTISESGISYPKGYVPLVGKDWPDTLMGEPYEERNLLNARGRISYVIGDDPSSFLKTDAPISSIEAVYVNGTKLSSSSYTIASLPRTISVSDLAAGDRVMVYFTYSSSPYSSSQLFSSTRASAFGGISNNRPFLWGGEDGATVYSAAQVSSASLADAQLGFSDSDSLYFPTSSKFIVGNGSSRISAVSRHYDRLLIFTQNDVWMADQASIATDTFPIMKVNSSVGVISPDASAMLGNEPCTVGEHSIYRWTSSTNELNECNCYSISKPIESLLPKSFFSNARVFADTRREELLFCSPELGDKIFIYSSRNRKWFAFDGVYADRFINCENDVGFIHEGKIYAFDSSAYLDNDEKEISATFVSNVLDPRRKCRLRALEAAYSGGELMVSFSLDGEATPSISSRLSCSASYVRAQARLLSRRCNNFRFTISASGEARQRIRCLGITYR